VLQVEDEARLQAETLQLEDKLTQVPLHFLWNQAENP